MQALIRRGFRLVIRPLFFFLPLSQFFFKRVIFSKRREVRMMQTVMADTAKYYNATGVVGNMMALKILV